MGLHALMRLVEDGDNLGYLKAKLNAGLFKPGDELTAFEFVSDHLRKYKRLPKRETMLQLVPSVAELSFAEPAGYYLDQLLNRFEYEVIGSANIESQEVLRESRDTERALSVINNANQLVIAQRYRHRIMDFGAEGKRFLRQNYHATAVNEYPVLRTGWSTLDGMIGTLLPGDVISIVGRPTMGKTWFALAMALYNYHVLNRNVMFVSMEMNTLAIAQRLGAMYSRVPYDQLKKAQMATGTFNAFCKGLDQLEHETGKLYVVNGNLMAEVEELYALAAQLGVDFMDVDGAYMLKHPNRRLNRYDRVAENMELIKQYTEELEMVSGASWQYAKSAVEKQKKKKGKTERADLEDIGYSDAIAQISSIVLGLMQAEGVETMVTRMIDILKGRSGETGRFAVNWNFATMDFSEVEDTPKPLEHL